MNKQQIKDEFINACEILETMYNHRWHDAKECPLCPIAIKHRNIFLQKHERNYSQICKFCIHARHDKPEFDPCLSQYTYRLYALNNAHHLREQFYYDLIPILKELPAERFYGGHTATRFPEIYRLDFKLYQDVITNLSKQSLFKKPDRGKPSKQ